MIAAIRYTNTVTKPRIAVVIAEDTVCAKPCERNTAVMAIKAIRTHNWAKPEMPKNSGKFCRYKVNVLSSNSPVLSGRKDAGMRASPEFLKFAHHSMAR